MLAFLKAHPSERLYLIGDIIDGWQLRRRWYWPQSHNDVVQKVLRRARKGCQVNYIPGNHDEFARHFVGHRFGGVEVVDEAVHVTADGRRLWVTHGDLYDGVIQYAKWLAYLGDTLYELALWVNRHLNSWRARLGLPYWSLSQYLKHRVKSAVSFITRFEQALAAEAQRRALDGVVCGHIHRPELRQIRGVLYCNDGDWVESLSALVEHADGRLEIVHWAQEHPPVVSAHAPTTVSHRGPGGRPPCYRLGLCRKPPSSRRPAMRFSTATKASWRLTSGFWTGPVGARCRCWSGCGFSPSCRPTSTSFSRCASRPTTRHACRRNSAGWRRWRPTAH